MKTIGYKTVVKTLGLFIAFLFISNTYGQSWPPGLRYVAPRTVPNAEIPKDRFRYSQFQPGQTFYDDEKNSALAAYNYDLVNGVMLAVTENGDTITLDLHTIKYFKIGNDVFLNNSKGDILEILGNDKIKLGVNSRYLMKPFERIPSFSPETAPVPGKQKIRFIRSDTYYISIGGKIKIFKATRSEILKNFPLQKMQIKKYVAENKVDFNSRKDLEQLVQVLNSMLDKKLSAI